MSVMTTATVEHINPDGLVQVRWTILVVEGQPLQPGFEASQRVWGQRPNPPVITVAVVAGLARPDALVEVEAVSVVQLDEPA